MTARLRLNCRWTKYRKSDVVKAKGGVESTRERGAGVRCLLQTRCELGWGDRHDWIKRHERSDIRASAEVRLECFTDNATASTTIMMVSAK
eukprot:scaffold41507_cov61-Phaeocystis_antarctica.AAC.1